MTALTEHHAYGPPGCGKTHYLTEKVELAAKRYGDYKVVCMSFTRAAAAVLASRVNLPPDQVGTLHAHAFHALGQPTIAETQIKEFNDRFTELSLSGGKGDLDEGSIDIASKTDGDLLMADYQARRARMIDRSLWPTRTQYFAACWDEFKRDGDMLDFTDLIEQCLLDVPEHPAKPKVIFADEVQDFTRLELALVRKWGENVISLLAGDDDQCIYHFKGATPDAFLRADLPPENKHYLRQSYRVPRAVQTVANKWVQQLRKREPKEYLPRDALGEVRMLYDGSWRNIEVVLNDAERYLEQGKSVMLLTSCSYMLDSIKAVLRERAWPYGNKYRRNRGDWNPLRGHGVTAAQRLLSFMAPDQEVFGESAHLWTYDDLQRWVQLVESDGVLKRGAKTILLGKHEDHAPQYQDLLKMFEEDALQEALMADPAWLMAHLVPSKQTMMQYPYAVLSRRGVKALIEEPLITVGTIHSVKGGEADVVYLFPDLSLAGMQEWVSPGEGHESIIRQFYVGMTRAKESLILVPPATNYSINLGVAL